MSEKRFVFLVREGKVGKNRDEIITPKGNISIDNIRSLVSYIALPSKVVNALKAQDIPFILTNYETDIKELYLPVKMIDNPPFLSRTENLLFGHYEAFSTLLEYLYVYGKDAYDAIKSYNKLIKSMRRRRAFRNIAKSMQDLTPLSISLEDNPMFYIQYLDAKTYRVMLFTLFNIFFPYLKDIEVSSKNALLVFEDFLFHPYNKGIPLQLPIFFYFSLCFLAVEYRRIDLEVKKIKKEKMDEVYIKFIIHFVLDRLNIINRIYGLPLQTISMYKYGIINNEYL